MGTWGCGEWSVSAFWVAATVFGEGPNHTANLSRRHNDMGNLPTRKLLIFSNSNSTTAYKSVIWQHCDMFIYITDKICLMRDEVLSTVNNTARFICGDVTKGASISVCMPQSSWKYLSFVYTYNISDSQRGAHVIFWYGSEAYDQTLHLYNIAARRIMNFETRLTHYVTIFLGLKKGTNPCQNILIAGRY